MNRYQIGKTLVSDAPWIFPLIPYVVILLVVGGVLMLTDLKHKDSVMQ